ncbi:MAG: hypothetical protein ACJ8F7_10690 [Gemmataceae bacterium]
MRHFVPSGCLAFVVATTLSAAPVKTEPLRGTVLAADGSPAAGALVWAAKHTYGPLQRHETVADAAGRFALKLGPGEWFLGARHGSQGCRGRGRNPIIIPEDRAPEPLTLHLEERGMLRGRLFEAETGKPIANGQLYLDAGVVLTTNAEGKFEIGGLERSNHESFVVAAGRVRFRVLFDTTEKADTELEVPVPRGGKIIGRVTDTEGKAIPGAFVGRATSGTSFSINALYTPCDADGRFIYDGVSLDTPSRLAAMAPGYQDDERDGLIVNSDGAPPELEFRLRAKPGEKPDPNAPADEKRRVVSGVVLRPGKIPIAGIKVMWGWHGYIGSPEMRTDDAGRFRLTVPDKAEYLSILPREYLPQFPHIEGSGDQSIEIVLQPGQSVRGQVVDDAGKPIKGVNVIAVIGPPEPGRGDPVWLRECDAHTNADGKFEMTGIPGHARFDFLKHGLSDLRFQGLKFDGSENNVTMLYGGALFGRVVDRDGKPIRNFRVVVGFPLQRLGGDRTEGFFAGYSGMGVYFTSADGNFVLTGVGAGSIYRVRALAEGHGEAVSERMAAVPSNRLAKAQPMMLQAGAPVSLQVKVQTADGKPISGARITLVNNRNVMGRPIAWGYDDAAWSNMARGRSTADGSAKFPALGFGDAEILVRAPGYARHHVSWGNGQKEVTLELAPEAVLTGVIRDADGKRVKNVYVNLGFGTGQTSTAVGPGDEGKFRVPELPAGPCQVGIRDENGRLLAEPKVTLKAGETHQLTIDLPRQ